MEKTLKMEKPWQNLPIEIIEKILFKVPTSDISVNKAWVCKNWTSVIQEPSFWIRKLFNLNITIEDAIRSALMEFDKNLQVACLYHACLNEENMQLKQAKNEDDLSLDNINDDTGEMLIAAGVLITKSVDTAGLILNKFKHPVLPILLKLLAVRGVWVDIYDYFGFWNFSPRYDFVRRLKGPNDEAKILNFVGCVTNLRGLKQEWDDEEEGCSLDRDIKLSIAVDENNKAIDPGISERHSDCRLLHINAGTDLSKLEIGEFYCDKLIVSGLEASEIIWMVKSARDLKLSWGYSLILFDYNLNMESTKELFGYWKRLYVEPVDIICASTTLRATEVKELNELAALYWIGCEEKYFVLYKSDEKLRKCKNFQSLFNNP